METLNLEKLKYPIGRFVFDAANFQENYETQLGHLQQLPNELQQLAQDLSPSELDKSYRPGGWTVRQVIHHLADSHMNGYARFKLALTEDLPTIKPYNEVLWAELPDTWTAPIEASISILNGLHHRWVQLIQAMEPADFEREIFHLEHQRKMSLKELLGSYSWHGRHHLAHINATRSH